MPNSPLEREPALNFVYARNGLSANRLIDSGAEYPIPARSTVSKRQDDPLALAKSVDMLEDQPFAPKKSRFGKDTLGPLKKAGIITRRIELGHWNAAQIPAEYLIDQVSRQPSDKIVRSAIVSIGPHDRELSGDMRRTNIGPRRHLP